MTSAFPIKINLSVLVPAATQGLTINSSDRIRWGARIAALLIVAYQTLLVVLVFLRPDLALYWHTLSEWAIGPHGWLMRGAFVLSGLSYFALTAALSSAWRSRVGKTGLVLLLLCALGAAGAGIFVTDPLDDSRHTAYGAIHAACGFGQLMLFPWAAALCGLALRRDPAMRHTALFPFPVSALPLIAWIGFMVHLALYVLPLHVQYGPTVPLGWPARILFLAYAAYILLTAVSLQSSSRNGQRGLAD